MIDEKRLEEKENRAVLIGIAICAFAGAIIGGIWGYAWGIDNYGAGWGTVVPGGLAGIFFGAVIGFPISAFAVDFLLSRLFR